MVIQDDYIDMDLTPTATPLPPASPRFEFHSAGAGAGGVGGGARRREGEEEEAFASPADELFYKGNLLPLHLPPRLQLVQRLLHEQLPPPPTTTQQGVKRDATASSAAAEEGDGGASAAAKVAKKPSWSKRLKVVKRWASREYIRSLFLATRPSDIVVDGNGSGSVSARAPEPDHEEVCHHRKSFSGIIRRVRLVATKAAAPAAPGVSPLCSSSSSSSSSSTPSCGTANGFFFRAPAAAPALKRSSSAGSEEGAIQGAIAHCKRSSQQGMAISAARRSSASDVVFYSVTNTPRASSVAAGEVAAQERQEMCRG
ncbi:hypothetical protein EJB05_34283, partial [Eragrostis curvula]